MLGKFAVMACPEPKCPKIGLSKSPICPEHKTPMVRTVVMTENYVRDHNKITKTFDDVLKGMRRG